MAQNGWFASPEYIRIIMFALALKTTETDLRKITSETVTNNSNIFLLVLCESS